MSYRYNNVPEFVGVTVRSACIRTKFNFACPYVGSEHEKFQSVRVRAHAKKGEVEGNFEIEI